MNKIERLESHIDELAGAVRRSRRLILIGNVSAMSGLALMAWWMLHSHSLGLTWFLTSVALSLGGLVLSGTSKSSTDELLSALRKAEQERDGAIDALDLRDAG